jgi:hypothetical protein
MDTVHLREWVSSCRPLAIARLNSHQLRFHKRSKDGSAKCDAFQTGIQSDFVCGVVFDVDPGEKGRLDRKEGLGQGYNEGDVFVTLDSGDEMKVLTYFADASAIDATLPVYADYKAHVLDGAREHSLPAPYIQSFIEPVLAIAKPKQSG